MTTRQKKREELDKRAKQGETVVPGGIGGKSLETQEHLAEGGQTRKEQIGIAGYQKMGRKGGHSTMDKSGEKYAAEEGIDINESKFTNEEK
ncbi:hypothetical protein HN51_005263 [Arachis hypogaea]|uniref:Uncharacterized protein n=1 Tax=Arachis hypogaea TaxID=3818 RepID=A0A445DFC5_ARAHY|nr:hypothetical protein Ahy_A04g019101 [Arachis hypogaea]